MRDRYAHIRTGIAILWHRPHTTVSRPTPSRIVRQPLSKNQIQAPYTFNLCSSLRLCRIMLLGLEAELSLKLLHDCAVCALCRMCVSNAPRAIPNISIPSNKRTSGAELTIVVFDLLTYGKDLRTERLLDRKQELRRLLAGSPDSLLKYTEYIDGRGMALFQ